MYQSIADNSTLLLFLRTRRLNGQIQKAIPLPAQAYEHKPAKACEAKFNVPQNNGIWIFRLVHITYYTTRMECERLYGSTKAGSFIS